MAKVKSEAEKLNRVFAIKVNDQFAEKVLTRANEMGGSISGYIKGLIIADLKQAEAARMLVELPEETGSNTNKEAVSS